MCSARFDPAFDLRRRAAASSKELLQRVGFDFGLPFNYLDGIGTDVLNTEEREQMQMEWFAQVYLPAQQVYKPGAKV